MPRVVVPVEGGSESVTALQWAAQEARRRAAVLVAVSVWSPYGGELAELQLPCPELCQAQWEGARDLLEASCQQARLPADIVVERRVARGRYGSVMAHLACGPRDLLVIAARHRLRDLLSRRLLLSFRLRHVRAPVLFLPSTPALHDA
ncbi:universal stress protein [Streptomyces roseus]